MKKKWKLKGAVPLRIPEKWSKAMRLTILLIFTLNVSVYAAGNAQSQKVSLEMRQASVEQILDAIGEQTQLQFFYNHEQLAGRTATDVSWHDTEVDLVLADLAEKMVFSYRYVDNYVIITPRQQTPEAQPQARTQVNITGKVTDTAGEPIIGASVTVKGTQTGVMTDVSGNFAMRFTKQGDADIILTISFLGYKPREVAYKNTPVTVVLEEDAVAISNLVVTGIFDRPRESYTGAVTSVTKEQIQTYRGQNLIQTLRNIDPSINLFENNEMGSDPNHLPEISIRGSSSLPRNLEELNDGVRNNLNAPLIIMDGFEITLQKLMDFNDDEVENINILKDASATAIYGSRGANGVIVITSRQPEAGKLRFNLKATFDVEMPDLTSYDLLNAAEKLQLEWDNGFYEYAGRPTADRSLKEAYYKRLSDVLAGTDTYWLSKPLRLGLTHKYNARLEGGSNEFRWGVTGAYGRTAGVMKNSYRDNFSGQINLQYNYKNLIFRNNTEVGINKGVNSNYGAFSSYARMNPYYKVYDEQGLLIRDYGYDENGRAYNPLYNASLKNIDETAYTEIINNFSIEWIITEGLTLRGRFGISKQINTSDNFLSPNHTTFLDASGDDVLRRGRYTYGSGQSSTYDGNVTLGYTKTFNDKHQLYAGLNYTVSQSKSHMYEFITEGFTNENTNSILASKAYQQNGMPSGYETFSRMLGLTGNANYTYDNRLFADVSFRVDGSSQFGSKKRFAPFWSFGAGWNIHNEEFFTESDLLNTLRLKVSYGQTGSQQFEAFQALSKFKYYLDDRYANWGGAYLDGLGNEDLKWQVTDQFNVGTEIGLFNNRLNIGLDYYIKKTSNLLSDIEIPQATGFSSYVANIGEVKNTGFEASVNGYLIRDTERDITWTATAKIAYNKNVITKLSEAIKRQNELYLEEDVDVARLYYEGYSQNSIYAVRSLGIDPSTGSEIYLDRNGEVTNTWNPSDKVYMGVSDPTYRGNIGTMFRYKNLSANLSFGFQFGGYAYNQTIVDRVELMRASIRYQNVDRRVLTDRWSSPGDVSEFKKIPGRDEQDLATRASSRFVMKNDIFQLQSASIEYRLDNKWLRDAGIQNARIGVNMSDLFYIASIKRERGTSYPFSRRVGASLSLMF